MRRYGRECVARAIGVAIVDRAELFRRPRRNSVFALGRVLFTSTIRPRHPCLASPSPRACLFPQASRRLESSAKRLYDWQRETNAAGQKLAVACRRRGRQTGGEPGRRAREKEGDRMTRTWSRTEGRDVTVPTSSYSHKPPHRPFSSSFLLRLLLILRRLLTDERGDSIISKLPKALKATRQSRAR